MLERRISLQDKEIWSLENATIIASALNYICDDRFLLALDSFIKQTVIPAEKITIFLQPLAMNHFSGVKPPLQQINGKTT